MSNTKMSQRSKSPRCPACGDRKMERHHEDHRTTIKHDGRAYEVCVPDLPVLRCAGCGEVIYGVDSNRRIDQALRHEIGVLSPDEIRSLRESVGLTQRALAELLGVAETSISRWESGAVIQSRSLDRLLRVFFTLPEVRKFMSRGCRRDQDDADSVLEIPSNQPSVDEGLARPQESSLFDEIFDEIRRGVADYATWSSGGRSRFHEYLRESRDHRSIPSRGEDVLEAGRSRLSTREEAWWARRERQRERLARLWIENGLDLREAAHLKDLLDQLVDAATGRLDSEASLREAKAPGPVRQALLAWALLSGEETAILEAARGYLLAAREEPSIGGLSPADGEWIRGQAARLAPIGSAVMARLRSAEFSGV